MKIYFAGTVLIREREELLFNANRLYSYFYHKETGMAYNDFKIRIENENILSNLVTRN